MTSFSNYRPCHKMSPPPPRPAQHLVSEAEREHYAAIVGCQARGLSRWLAGAATAGLATETGRESEFGRPYGTMRWTGLPRIVTDQVAVSLPAPVTL